MAYTSEVKDVKLFKFLDKETGKQINIYIEPIEQDKGRIILSDGYKIYQRFFDGMGTNCFGFISNRPIDQFAASFEKAYEEGEYEFITKTIIPIWKEFQSLLSDHIDSEKEVHHKESNKGNYEGSFPEKEIPDNITVLDYYAGQAMALYHPKGPEISAEKSFSHALAMLEERKKYIK